MRLHRPDPASAWRVAPQELLKQYAPYTLLCLAWLEPNGTFAADARACLVGVAGGSLVHFWRECVPGGASLRVDAVEVDAAVLEAARAHMGLAACEVSGH